MIEHLEPKLAAFVFGVAFILMIFFACLIEDLDERKSTLRLRRTACAQDKSPLKSLYLVSSSRDSGDEAQQATACGMA